MNHQKSGLSKSVLSLLAAAGLTVVMSGSVMADDSKMLLLNGIELPQKRSGVIVYEWLDHLNHNINSELRPDTNIICGDDNSGCTHNKSCAV